MPVHIENGRPWDGCIPAKDILALTKLINDYGFCDRKIFIEACYEYEYDDELEDYDPEDDDYIYVYILDDNGFSTDVFVLNKDGWTHEDATWRTK